MHSYNLYIQSTELSCKDEHIFDVDNFSVEAFYLKTTYLTNVSKLCHNLRNHENDAAYSLQWCNSLMCDSKLLETRALVD